MSTKIQQIEAEQMNREIPEFGAGDTVVVNVKVREGDKERLQAFEGVCIAKRNRGLNSAFTLRKISYGEGVERVFQTYSPLIDSIKVKRRGDVRRAKLYYMRDLTGKAARIKEKLSNKAAGEEKAEKTAKAKPAAEKAKPKTEKPKAEAAKAEKEQKPQED